MNLLKKINDIKFKIDFFFLKRNFNKIKKYSEKLKKITTEKRKFRFFFIKDEEDEFLNNEVLKDFDKKIKKYNYKLFKFKIKLNKKLFKLGFIDLNYIDIFYKRNLSEENILLIKEIIKYKINEK